MSNRSPWPPTPPDTSPKMSVAPSQVSVIIPAYNAQRYLEETLRSVQAQTFQSWECIIVDDGSTDKGETARIVNEFARKDARIRLLQERHRGAGGTRNIGFARSDARAPYVAFLDADDVWEPGALQCLVSTLDAHPQAPAAHGNGCYINADGRVMNDELAKTTRERLKFNGRRVVKCRPHEPTTFEIAATGQPIATPGMVLIRREALQRVGAFETTLLRAQDWDLWVRLSRLAPIVFVDAPVIRYRKHPDSASTKMLVMTRAVAKVRRRTVNAPENTPAQRDFALRAYRAFYFYSARSRLRAFFIVLTRERRFKAAAVLLAQTLANTLMALRGKP